MRRKNNFNFYLKVQKQLCSDLGPRECFSDEEEIAASPAQGCVGEAGGWENGFVAGPCGFPRINPG